MNPTLHDRLVDYYTPLVQDFLREVEPLDHPAIERMPEPFFPAFGEGYENSALRMIIIGQDTLGWGDLREFLAAEKSVPGSVIRERLDYFSAHPFREWGPSRQRFWGFAMMFLAALHDRDDWGAMKTGEMSEILDSFAWGNGNAVELHGSSAAGLGVPAEYWNAVRQSADRFNRFRHIVETLRPNVAVIMYWGIHLPTYLEGCEYELISSEGRLAHYHLKESGTDVFHVPHPGSMNRIEGTEHFRDVLKTAFQNRGLIAEFPKFLSGQEEGEKVMDFLMKNAPERSETFHKYEFVAWMALELKKRSTFMSVPTLMELVNARGYTTDYGTTYEGGRGSYKLVSGTYHRMMEWDFPDHAKAVAEAFRRPNFEYAYNTDD